MDGSIAPPGMAVTRRKAEQQVSGLEWPLNLHLAKLLGLDAPPETRSVWKREGRAWCGQVATLRIKPACRPLPAATLLAEEMPRNGASPETVAGRLRAFHEAAAPELAQGRIPLAAIEAL